MREEEGLSQCELAKRIGVSQPRVVAIEQSRNVTLDVLDQYVEGLGGRLEVNVVNRTRKVALVGGSKSTKQPRRKAAKRSASTVAKQSSSPPKELSPHEVKEAIRLYESGLNLKQVGAKLGFDSKTVRKYLAEAGVKIRPSRGQGT